MQYGLIRTLALMTALAAVPVHGAEPEPQGPPAPPAVPQSGMPDALYQAVTSDTQKPTVTTHAVDLPPYVLTLLSRYVRRFADAEQTYGPTETPVAGEESRPTERLVWAARIDDYYLVNWEYNGGGYTGAATHAFRMEPNGKARYVWSARLNRSNRVVEGQINPYRSLLAFTDAVERGEIAGSNGRCSNLMFATPAAVNLLLRRRTGPAVTDLAALPVPVQDTVRFTQGPTIKWAVPVADHYVVNAQKDAGEVIALIRNPPSTANRAVWKGQTPPFARFEDFQEALRNSMSPESEAEIRAGRCTNPTRAQR